VIELVRLEEVIRKFLVRLDVARARAKERSLRGEHGSSVLGVIRGVRASRIERDRGGDEERERGASSGRRAAFRARGRGGDTARGVGEDAHGAETCADSVVIQSRDVGTSGRKSFGAYRRVVLQWRSAFAADTLS